ncbi:MAG: hypothetical protein HYT72_04640 [Candidatus Aenigmarchaeota archaeon]|nr:hypothetical protein [Candidatus Aenigmarchaeota archaeon]
MKTFEGEKIDGSSPPSVFIGRKGYPNVFIGPLIPPVHGDTSLMDTPEKWADKGAGDIIDFRFQLVRGKQLVNVNDKSRITGMVREIALSKNPLDIDAAFSKKPRGSFFNEDVQPFGPSAPIKTMEIGNVKFEHHLERAYYDTDLLAREAVLSLYTQGLFVSTIQKAFSVGAFGLKENRKLVPTRWSITAVDSTLSENHLENVRHYPLIDTFRVYEAENINNRFVILLLPTEWKYETMEAWFPSVIGDRLEIYGDWEGHDKKKDYAAIGGCYYAARLAVAEQLEKERKQAGVIIFRESYPGYIPLGVWNVRENVRQAMQRFREFESLNEALTYVSSRVKIPMQQWILGSRLLKETITQRRLSDFAK